MVVDGDRVGALDAVEQVPARRARRAARSRTRRRRAARRRAARAARRSRAAGRWTRSRWCRRWRRRPSGRARRAGTAPAPGAAPPGPSAGRGRQGRTRRRRGPGRAAGADFWTLKWLSVGGEDPQLPGGRQPEPVVSGPFSRHASFRASSSAWRLDWLPPLVNTPSAAAPRPMPLGGPVDQPALDQGAARALVPGVQRGVDGGEDGLAEQGRDHDRAVEVGRVRGVVEVDRVAEVDVLQLVEGGGGIRPAGRPGPRRRRGASARRGWHR